MIEANYVGTTTFHTTLGNTVPGNAHPTSLTEHFVSNEVFTTLGPTGRLIQTVPNPFFGVVPSNTALGSISRISVQNLLSAYPEFSNVNLGSRTGGTTYYHSLQVTLNKRLSDLATVHQHGFIPAQAHLGLAFRLVHRPRGAQRPAQRLGHFLAEKRQPGRADAVPVPLGDVQCPQSRGVRSAGHESQLHHF